MLITGPNMGGKSCFIRQTALIVIMAQIGCYVPAESCSLHVVDNIYTRMGASDNLAAGRSTFEVELTETSRILAKASPRSLVIIDELGRGTSTHDGVAIASATLEHILHTQHCLTLFVTHYPELGNLRTSYPTRLGAYFMEYAQEQKSAGGEGSVPRITFLYKLAPGVVGSSFGLNVAALAGLPPAVVARGSIKAKEIEAELKARRAEREAGRLRASILDICTSVSGRDAERLKREQAQAREVLERTTDAAGGSPC
uniref:DNA mismatch repair protein MSH3 n=3 Tax=Tetraselmis sp. GSL018 TaxID=582737 RepID=A0A061R6K3_9CHLO